MCPFWSDCFWTLSLCLIHRVLRQASPCTHQWKCVRNSSFDMRYPAHPRILNGNINSANSHRHPFLMSTSICRWLFQLSCAFVFWTSLHGRHFGTLLRMFGYRISHDHQLSIWITKMAKRTCIWQWNKCLWDFPADRDDNLWGRFHEWQKISILILTAWSVKPFKSNHFLEHEGKTIFQLHLQNVWYWNILINQWHEVVFWSNK